MHIRSRPFCFACEFQVPLRHNCQLFLVYIDYLSLFMLVVVFLVSVNASVDGIKLHYDGHVDTSTQQWIIRFAFVVGMH